MNKKYHPKKESSLYNLRWTALVAGSAWYCNKCDKNWTVIKYDYNDGLYEFFCPCCYRKADPPVLVAA